MCSQCCVNNNLSPATDVEPTAACNTNHVSNYPTSIYPTHIVKTLTVREMPIHYTCQALYKIQLGNFITPKL